VSFVAATSHSVAYYVLGFIAGISMILTGITQLQRQRKAKAAAAADKAAAESASEPQEAPKVSE
jgi:predicted phage tail protein